MNIKQHFIYAMGFMLFGPISVMAMQDVDTVKNNPGRLLYFDQNLSINRNQSCASCHAPPGIIDPENALDPVNSVVSLGSYRDLNGGRNSPSAGYAALSPLFHWDASNVPMLVVSSGMGVLIR